MLLKEKVRNAAETFFDWFIPWVPWWLLGGLGLYSLASAGVSFAAGSSLPGTFYILAGLVLLWGASMKVYESRRQPEGN